MPFLPSPSDMPVLDAARHGLALQGLTLLAVEDSRFASDALRLLCQRSGARLRRAATIEAATAHLRVYRPDVVLVDLGLPDGRGEGLIRAIKSDPGRDPIILAMSGDPSGRGEALAAGAAGFIEKPIAGLAEFQAMVRAHLPDASQRSQIATGGPLTPDPLALLDDLKRAADLLNCAPGPDQLAYISGFLGGIARQTEDPALAAASLALRAPRAVVDPVAQLIGDRLRLADAFAPAT